MSAFNDLDIECVQCGETFKGAVWTAVHAGEDPELKDLLLGGELNMVMCSACSHVTFQTGFLLYQEPALQLVAYVYPPDEEAQEKELKIMMLKAWSEAQSVLPPEQKRAYEPVLLFGLDSLAELIREKDALKLKEEIEKARHADRSQ